MTRTEPIIAVQNVQKSSEFHQNLVNCQSQHGGETFEILTDDGVVLLCLHKWGEHEHPTMLSPGNQPGNGLILFFRVNNLQQIFENALKINAAIEKEIHYNENSQKKSVYLAGS